MSAHMICLPREPKVGNKKSAKSPLLHRLIQDLSPSKCAVKKLYAELKRRSAHRRHEQHARSVILQKNEINHESTTFKLSSSIDIDTESKVNLLTKSRTKASKISLNKEIIVDNSDRIVLHRDDTNKTLSMDINNKYNPNNSVASSTVTSTTKMFMATPYHNFSLITSGYIDYNIFGLIEYSIYGYFDQGYSINLVAGMNEVPWALFIPGSTYASELNILWSRMSIKKEAEHKTKLAQWILNCTTLEFDNRIKSASFDHKLFVNYHIHEITIILDKGSRVLTVAIRNYSIVNRQKRELRMKQVADAGRNLAVQRIRAYHGYKGNKMNNFSGKYNNIMRSSTQNMKYLYKADRVAKVKRNRAICNEANAYDPEKSELSTTLADYALDWIEDYEGVGDAYHIDGESKGSYLSEPSRDNLAIIDTHESNVDGDYLQHHKSGISLYNTKPLVTSEFDPFGLFTHPVIQKKHFSRDSALSRNEYDVTNNFDAEENIEYEIEEIEEEEVEDEHNVVVQDQNIFDQDQPDDQQNQDKFPVEEVSSAVAVVVTAEAKGKGGFLSSLSSFFFGGTTSTITATIVSDQVALKPATEDILDIASDASAMNNLITPFAATDNPVESSFVMELNKPEVDTEGSSQDTSSFHYETMLERRGEDWASSLFKN